PTSGPGSPCCQTCHRRRIWLRMSIPTSTPTADLGRADRKVARMLARVARTPDNAPLLQGLGKALMSRAFLKGDGDYADAEHAFRRSIAADPVDPWSHLYLANVFYAK